MSDTIRKDLGPVSAYALAVAYGYTGTEEEWATEQAACGTNAASAKDAADSATKSKDAAGVSEQNAKASETNAAKSEANTKTSETNSKASETAAGVSAETALEAAQMLTDYATEATPPIVERSGGTVIAVSDSAQRPPKGLRLFGKTTQDGTPTPDAPVELVGVGDKGTIVNTVAGKNLIDPAEITANSDRTHIYVYRDDGFVLPAGTYTLHIGSECSSTCVRPYGSEENLFVKYSWAPLTFTLTETKKVHFLFYDSDGIAEGAENTIQLEHGSTATDYEPYTAQTLTAQTPNGLPGIPVDSDGNYTDANGQQWVCDEVDFARGKYVKRVHTYTFTGLEGFTWEKSGEALSVDTALLGYPAKVNGTVYPSLCSLARYDSSPSMNAYGAIGQRISATSSKWIFRCAEDSSHPLYTYDRNSNSFNAALVDNPITVAYILATPIETDLTAEELVAYAALHTNYPHTTVYNDEGAWMEMDYVADTKIYIDNKFAELNAAILSLGGNV